MAAHDVRPNKLTFSRAATLVDVPMDPVMSKFLVREGWERGEGERGVGEREGREGREGREEGKGGREGREGKGRE